MFLPNSEFSQRCSPKLMILTDFRKRYYHYHYHYNYLLLWPRRLLLLLLLSLSICHYYQYHFYYYYSHSLLLLLLPFQPGQNYLMLPSLRMPWLRLATSFPSWIHFASRDGPRLWKCFGIFCWPTTEGICFRDQFSDFQKKNSWGSWPMTRGISGWNFFGTTTFKKQI